MNNYPLNAFPELIRNAVLSVHEQTRAPVPLIASSVISAVSLTCQGCADVRVSERIVSPVSLFMLVIADSGERKTTADRLVMAPVYAMDEAEQRSADPDTELRRVDEQIWEEKKKSLLAEIRRKTAKGLNADEPAAQLKQLYGQKPAAPKIRKRIYNNTTPEALQYGMYTKSPHVGLIADEGANILDRRIMNDLTFLNSVWDGVPFQVERKTGDSFIIDDGRITLSVMVQKAVFDSYMKRQGDKARGSGFFARCLPVFISDSLSTRGTRFISDTPVYRYSLTPFHERIIEIINRAPGDNKVMLSFSAQAQTEWNAVYNYIEEQMAPGMPYYQVADCASKLANNIARLAALFSFFADDSDIISEDNVKAAEAVCLWYMDQMIHIFSHRNGEYEKQLLDWLSVNYDNSGSEWIRKNEIRQYGPSLLRKGKLLDSVLDRLEKYRCIRIDRRFRSAVLIGKGYHFYNNPFTNEGNNSV
ncbi:YfjI family protein [Morganella morganii]|uniref:YfjI family protein n=1 Tax=Morganella morganii TaxID=582 RepID=UPI001BDAB33C|nr:YfjI family protein [Morganella morganii]MBT0345889.1 DUF3987 domain-containing protein [Morganella morganii subsp. morganii]HDU8580784.1 DUF3987 domain-containing protein [Morganella morganii]